MLSFNAELAPFAAEDCVAVQQQSQYKKDSGRATVETNSRWGFVSSADDERDAAAIKAGMKDLTVEELNLDTEAMTAQAQECRSDIHELVHKAEERLFGQNLDKEYSCLEGPPEFRAAAGALLLGKDHPALTEGRVATVQSLAETGAMRLGAAFLQRFFPDKTVYISNPTAKTHKTIFSDAGVPWKTYRYFDAETCGLDFGGMVDDLTTAPDGSVVVLNGCGCHMTGVDLTDDQWKTLCDLCATKEHLPFLDLTHQGLASGSLKDDIHVLEQFISQGQEVMVIQSFSQNLALSAHCVGALHFIVKDNNLAARVQSQLKMLSRAFYAFAPVHGSRIVTEIENNTEFLDEWNSGLKSVTNHVQNVRNTLQCRLAKIAPLRDWSFLSSQTGIFACLGLSPQQVSTLQRAECISVSEKGCIALTALPLNKVEYVANAIARVLFEYLAEE